MKRPDNIDRDKMSCEDKVQLLAGTVKGETAYLRANCVSGILPDTSRKTGAVIYCDPPIECLAVDESVVDVYAMLYEELEEDEDDDITDEQYSDIIESYQAMRAAEQGGTI